MKLREDFYTSYKTHNNCGNCGDGHKKGWTLKKDTPGVYCPNCGYKLRKNPRAKKKYSGGRY
jgi:DNA-directed RNA polymerase subunit RPC12/RpoP